MNDKKFYIDTIHQLEVRINELEAACIAYASEFPINDAGDPDVGNIHQNYPAT